MHAFAIKGRTHTRASLAMNKAQPGLPAIVRAAHFTIQIPLEYHSQKSLPQRSMAEREIDTEKSLAYWNSCLSPDKIATPLALGLNRAAETLI